MIYTPQWNWDKRQSICDQSAEKKPFSFYLLEPFWAKYLHLRTSKVFGQHKRNYHFHLLMLILCIHGNVYEHYRSLSFLRPEYSLPGLHLFVGLSVFSLLFFYWAEIRRRTWLLRNVQFIYLQKVLSCFHSIHLQCEAPSISCSIWLNVNREHRDLHTTELIYYTWLNHWMDSTTAFVNHNLFLS